MQVEEEEAIPDDPVLRRLGKLDPCTLALITGNVPEKVSVRGLLVINGPDGRANASHAVARPGRASYAAGALKADGQPGPVLARVRAAPVRGGGLPAMPLRRRMRRGMPLRGSAVLLRRVLQLRALLCVHLLLHAPYYQADPSRCLFLQVRGASEAARTATAAQARDAGVSDAGASATRAAALARQVRCCVRLILRYPVLILRVRA